MPSNPYTAYLEANIVGAEPIELVRMLYRAALDAVGDARVHGAAGETAERGRAISKATSIVRELAMSLNPQADPALAHDLRELYDYIERRLLTANFEKTEAPLAEVAVLLATMSEAWEKVSPATGEQAASERISAEA